jgi:hypothetical protein
MRFDFGFAFDLFGAPTSMAFDAQPPPSTRQEEANPTTEQEFRAVYPLIAGWIERTLAEHATAARPAASFGFSRLPDYYDAQVLASSKVVVVSRVPIPPLSAMGIDRFRDFERMNAGGITYLNTYFVNTDRARDESLHFHELVHVIQWRVLGPERFLRLYADGLERLGYRKSPLEVMAFSLQHRFQREAKAFSVEAACQRLIEEMASHEAKTASHDRS